MSIVSPSDFEAPSLTIEEAVKTFAAPGLPPSTDPFELDVFSRHVGVPAHRQELLANASALVVGSGGLGSWTDVALIRSGIGHLTVVEHDRFDRSNMSRQYMHAEDLGQPKAISVARNLVGHAPAPAQITAMAMTFDDAVKHFPISADVAVFLVDNNACRLSGAKWARERRIPAVFGMLSLDSMIAHVFFQGPDKRDPCLHCALPNLDPDRAAPCAAAVISSCFLVASYVTFFVHRALMGWPDKAPPFNWREADLLGIAPDRTGVIVKRQGCATCGDALSTLAN